MNTIMVEIIGAIGVIAPVFGGFLLWIYKTIIKPTKELIEDHGSMIEDITDIKKELMRNGGSSIKDAVGRMEKIQAIIDQRSRAAFFNIEKPIFEVNKCGHVIWANNHFYKTFENRHLTGLDWLSILDETERKFVFEEFISCADNNRELIISSKCMNGDSVKIHGFPYRGQNINHGFLIFFQKGE
jgi:hypothetical protein